jgi:hypothetical protein
MFQKMILHYREEVRVDQGYRLTARVLLDLSKTVHFLTFIYIYIVLWVYLY